MHSAFLFHAIKAGLDLAIINAAQLTVYETIPKDLLEHVEDVIFNRRPDATDRLVRFAATVVGKCQHPGAGPEHGASWASKSDWNMHSSTALSSSSSRTSRKLAALCPVHSM